MFDWYYRLVSAFVFRRRRERERQHQVFQERMKQLRTKRRQKYHD